jgi:SAM-dependent methyltransferase
MASTFRATVSTPRLQPVAAPSAPLGRLLDRADAAFTAWRHPAAVIEMLSTGLFHIRASLNRDRWLAACAAMQVHPIMARLRQDPLIARSLDKPRGHAGDAVMIDMIHRHPDRRSDLAGASPLGRSIHLGTTASPVAVAVRGRRQQLAELIDAAATGGQRPSILALAAGHVRELELATAMTEGRIGRFVALDPDEKSGSVAAARYGKAIEVLPQSISAVLRDQIANPHFDLVYAAGLFDYLDTRVATRLTRAIAEMLKPGGRFVFACFAEDLWEAGFLEAAMAWHLILRGEDDVTAILTAATRGLDGFSTRVWTGSNGTLLYGEVARAG